MRDFPLFQSHLDLAHSYWKSIILPGDCVVDATCGNGHDTLFIAQLALNEEKKGLVIAIDTQKQAIEATRERLATSLSSELLPSVSFINQCHSQFPDDLPKESVKLIVYNLGYLPGGDKSLTTQNKTTLESLAQALTLICRGGAISITCYPGHPEGKVEEQLILEFISTLDPKKWNCCHHRWMNRKQSPSLLLIQRSGCV